MTFLRLLSRELLLSVRHGGDTLAAVLFFVLAGSLFPLAIGPAPEVLARLAPGVVWVCALLAALLPLDRLFGADGEDGSLDQLLLCGLPGLGRGAGQGDCTLVGDGRAAAGCRGAARTDAAGGAGGAAGVAGWVAARDGRAVPAGQRGGGNRAWRSARRCVAAPAAVAAGDAGSDLRSGGRRCSGIRAQPAAPFATCCARYWRRRCRCAHSPRERRCGPPASSRVSARVWPAPPPGRYRLLSAAGYPAGLPRSRLR